MIEQTKHTYQNEVAVKSKTKSPWNPPLTWSSTLPDAGWPVDYVQIYTRLSRFESPSNQPRYKVLVVQQYWIESQFSAYRKRPHRSGAGSSWFLVSQINGILSATYEWYEFLISHLFIRWYENSSRLPTTSLFCLRPYGFTTVTVTKNSFGFNVMS